VSLLGEADFHVLRYSGDRVYGYNGLSGQLMISADRGVSWQSSNVPEPLFDLAVDPRRPNHLIASTELGIIERTTNSGWTRLGDQIGLLSWPDDGPLFVVEGDGKVSVSADGGGSWKSRGRLPEAPVALTSSSADDIYAALKSGTILNSNDGGRTWTTRVRP